MKSAEEILSQYLTVLTDGSEIRTKGGILKAMEEYASQFKQECISVDDKLPENNGYYIGWVDDEPGLFHYHEETGWQNGFYDVTHWAHFPKPPKK